MKINCDMGESYGIWKMGNVEQELDNIRRQALPTGAAGGRS